MRRAHVLFALSLAAAFALVAERAASDPIWLPSDLSPGDTYHLAFLTSFDGMIAATSGDIAVYNAFVDAYGDAIAGSPYGDVTWMCIGSTATVDARDNAPVSGPVYRFDGRRVADNAADLWTPANYYDFLPPITPQGFLGDYVWTGTRSNGTKHATAYLGSANAMMGYPGNYDGRWVQWGTFDSTAQWHLYALSEPLTMIPEPGTWALTVVALMVGGFVVRVRRRRAQNA